MTMEELTKTRPKRQADTGLGAGLQGMVGLD